MAGAPVNAGEYEVSAEITANGTLFNVTTATLTIEKKTITFVPTATSYTKVYGEDDPEYGYTFTGIVDADAGKEIYTGTISRLNAAAHEDANLYTNEKFDVSGLALTEEGAVNYVIGPYSTYFTLDIKPCQIKPENLIIKTPKIAYTGSLRNVEYEVVVNGKTVPASAYDVSGNTGRKVGTYNLEISAEGGNYYTDDEFEPVEGSWEIVNVGKAVVQTKAADLSGKIKLNIYISLPDSITDSENEGYIIYSKGDVETTLNVSQLSYRMVGTEKQYRISVPYGALEFYDKVNIRVFDKDGVAVPLVDKDGNDFTENGFDYSIVDYLDAIMEKSANQKMVTLAQATKDYGIASMKYFGNTDPSLEFSDAFSSITSEQISGYVTIEDTLPEGVKKPIMTLELVDAVTFRLKISFESGYSASDYVFTLDGEEVELVNNAFVIPFIASNKLDENHVFTISDGVTTYTTTRSALSYAYGASVNSKKTLSDLGKAVYAYNQKANAYFGD